MMCTAKVIVYLCLMIWGHDCANILGVFPMPGKSHYIMFERVMLELAAKGHNVDVVTHFPLKTKVPRFNNISIRGSFPIFTNNFTLDVFQNGSFGDELRMIMTLAGTAVCQSSFDTKELRQLRNSSKTYDVVITELFSTDCMLGWAWHFKAPSVVMTSSENLPWGSDRFGQPDNPAYIPTYFVEYTSRMSFWERLVNTWTLVKSKLLYEIYSIKQSNVIAKTFFGPDMPDLDVLIYNTSLHLINTHFSIGNSRPLVPNVVEVAGLHLKQPKPLDQYFNQLLQTDTKGVIYFSMGSLFLTESFPIHTLQAMFDALAEVPYKVLWKGNKEKFSKHLRMPTNIQFEPWMPQHDILCDPRVKLFISHGGMMGTQEAIHCGKPILGIPLFADQTLNLKRAVAAGYALRLDLNTITKEDFSRAIKKLLYDETYTKAAKTISSLFNDRPLGPLDTAIYWIEYIIRHQGAPHLHSRAKGLSWYQYYLIDVLIAMLPIPFIGIYLIHLLTKTAINRIFTKIKVKTS